MFLGTIYAQITRGLTVIRLLRNIAYDNDASKTIISPKRSTENNLFEETSYKAIKTAQRRKWTLIGLIVAILLVGVSLLIYNQMTTSKNLKLANEYANIEEIFNKENSENQKIIEQFKGNLPKDFSPNFEKSMPLFAEYAKKYVKEPIGWQAGIRSATYYISKNLNNKAKEILEPIVIYSAKYPLIQVKVRTTLAGIYLTEKQEQKALSEISIVEAIVQNPEPNQARLLKAQISYAMGDKEQAIKILNQIISSNSEQNKQNQTSEIQQQAKVWLNFLESN